ncbi:hypothetical protein [Velocimicrobium porci]|uniref:Uncharacterized protein n=1 Tax=Velocimicrobium porci TaxID=2606634 RepID=A0A6L5XXM3_9FIRM|nr:hypothetical protein [Velocimicrobium porci]MSS63287.1 hypothetical protein [Velocimicrobium porci]
MVKWCDKLYMDDKIKKKPQKWRKRLEQEKLSYELYCIALASNHKNLLDIIDCNELLFRYYKKRDICVVGLAGSRESAILLVQNIIEDVYRETGGVNVRAYFKFEESVEG